MPTVEERIRTLEAYIAQATAERNRLWQTEGFRQGVRISGLDAGIALSRQEIARLRAGTSNTFLPASWPTASAWSTPTLTTATVAQSGANPNFVNQNDVFNFYLEVSSGRMPYTSSYTADFRNRLAADGMRPIAVDDSRLGSLFGGTIVGQFQATHGYGPWADVANRIAGMAVAAGFRVNYTGNSPRVEPFLRNAPPGYSPNTIGSIYTDGNAPSAGDGDGDWPDWLKKLAESFNVSVVTLVVGGIFIYMWSNQN